MSSALNNVSQQRVTIDNSITQITSASNAVTSDQMQLTGAQTNLMQADWVNLGAPISSETNALEFLDRDTANYPQKFYRLQPVP